MNAITQGSAVLVLFLGGCSLMLGGIDKGRDGKQLPRCMDTHVPIYADGFIASVVAATGAGVTRSYENVGELPPDVVAKVVVGTLAVAVGFTVSAAIGARTYNRCRVARAEWHVQDAIRASGTNAGPDTPSASKEPGAMTTAHRRSSSTAPIASGSHTPDPLLAQREAGSYFCTSSPSRPEVNACEHGRLACNHTRRTLALHDSTACSPSDTVWCSNIAKRSRCFGTEQACESQAMTTDASGPCVERTGKRP
jgi:hypothetical protein